MVAVGVDNIHALPVTELDGPNSPRKAPKPTRAHRPGDHVDTLYALLIALGGGTTFVSIFSNGTQRAIERFLQGHFDKNLEHYKAELNIKSASYIETLKSNLQRESNTAVEHAKAQLATQNEQLRHELNKQIIRAQLATNSIHTELLDVARLTRIAQGRYLGLSGIISEQTYEGYSRSDIRRLLKDAKTPQLEAREIVRLFPENLNEGAKRIHEILRRKRISDATKACDDARNKIVINRMLLSHGLYKQAMGVVNKIQNAITDIEYRIAEHIGSHEITKRLDIPNKIDAEIEALEDAMSRRILPSELDQADLPSAPIQNTQNKSTSE
ncbi:hypothetical protein [Corallococcus sp. AB030]|uniref:hypothetical protein n=1 Tax=Corallococcus sp. AB030 TaxID=2316716 RepID=UPI0011E5F37B|nr:hypothetical protein [Corallococcus sp. AB030]